MHSLKLYTKTIIDRNRVNIISKDIAIVSDYDYIDE